MKRVDYQFNKRSQEKIIDLSKPAASSPFPISGWRRLWLLAGGAGGRIRRGRRGKEDGLQFSSTSHLTDTSSPSKVSKPPNLQTNINLVPTQFPQVQSPWKVSKPPNKYLVPTYKGTLLGRSPNLQTNIQFPPTRALSLEGLQTSSLQQERRSKRGSLQGAGEQSAPRLAVSDKNISKKDIVIFCLSKTITTEVVIFLLVSGWNLQNVILDFRSPTCILHL